MLFLAAPSSRYRESYLAAAREAAAEGREAALPAPIVRLETEFDGVVRDLLDQVDPAKLPEGWVPGSVFWLIDEDEYVGRLSVRHELNDWLRRVGGHIGYDIRPSRRRQGYGTAILRLGLVEARRLGLRRVLLTCDEDNIGSRKIIERNGGRFEDAVQVEGQETKKLRYWIDLS